MRSGCLEIRTAQIRSDTHAPSSLLPSNRCGDSDVRLVNEGTPCLAEWVEVWANENDTAYKVLSEAVNLLGFRAPAHLPLSSRALPCAAPSSFFLRIFLTCVLESTLAMKFTAVLVALTSVTYVMAGNCKTGLSYCGRSLLNIGMRRVCPVL
jgi:hypothetical protein